MRSMKSIKKAIMIRLNRVRRIKQYSSRYVVLRILELSRFNVCSFLSFVLFKVKCRIHAIECGKKIVVYGNVVIRGPGKIIIGNNVAMNSSPWRCASSSVANSVRFRTHTYSPRGDNKIIIGNNVGLQGTSITARSTTVRIGDHTLIGPDCMITDADFHSIWPPSERTKPGVESDAPVNIGEHVFIGSRCIILKGVTIGDNSVIISGSVVLNDIPKNALVGGNPAKVLRLFPDVQDIFLE